jgi:hypothetical protein
MSLLSLSLSLSLFVGRSMMVKEEQKYEEW